MSGKAEYSCVDIKKFQAGEQKNQLIKVDWIAIGYNMLRSMTKCKLSHLFYVQNQRLF